MNLSAAEMPNKWSTYWNLDAKEIMQVTGLLELLERTGNSERGLGAPSERTFS